MKILLGCLLVLMLGFLPQQAGAQAPAGAPSSQVLVQAVTCPSCSVMDAVFGGAMNLTDSVVDTVTESLRGLMVAILALWILLQAAKVLMPFGPLDRVPGMFNSMAGVTFLTLAIVVSLASPSLYQRYILHPIIDASVSASNTVLVEAANVSSSLSTSATAPRPIPPIQNPTAMGGTPQFSQQIVNSLVDHVRIVQDSLQQGICKGLSASGFVDRNRDNPRENCLLQISLPQTSQLTAGALGRVLGAAGNFLSAVGVFVPGGSVLGSGLSVAGEAMKAASGTGSEQGFKNALMSVLVALSVVVLYGWVWIKYPFYLLDVVAKWAILSILWPLLAASLILPATRPAAFAGLKGLGHAALTLVFLSAVIGVSLSVVDQVWAETTLGTANNVTLTQPGFWVIAIMGFIMVFFMKEAPRLAGSFIDSAIDLEVAEGLFAKVKNTIYGVADFATAGKTAMARKVLNIK